MKVPLSGSVNSASYAQMVRQTQFSRQMRQIHREMPGAKFTHRIAHNLFGIEMPDKQGRKQLISGRGARYFRDNGDEYDDDFKTLRSGGFVADVGAEARVVVLPSGRRRIIPRPDTHPDEVLVIKRPERFTGGSWDVINLGTPERRRRRLVWTRANFRYTVSAWGSLLRVVNAGWADNVRFGYETEGVTLNPDGTVVSDSDATELGRFRPPSYHTPNEKDSAGQGVWVIDGTHMTMGNVPFDTATYPFVVDPYWEDETDSGANFDGQVDMARTGEWEGPVTWGNTTINMDSSTSVEVQVGVFRFDTDVIPPDSTTGFCQLLLYASGGGSGTPSNLEAAWALQQANPAFDTTLNEGEWYSYNDAGIIGSGSANVDWSLSPATFLETAFADTGYLTSTWGIEIILRLADYLTTNKERWRYSGDNVDSWPKITINYTEPAIVHDLAGTVSASSFAVAALDPPSVPWPYPVDYTTLIALEEGTIALPTGAEDGDLLVLQIVTGSTGVAQMAGLWTNVGTATKAGYGQTSTYWAWKSDNPGRYITVQVEDVLVATLTAWRRVNPNSPVSATSTEVSAFTGTPSVLHDLIGGNDSTAVITAGFSREADFATTGPTHDSLPETVEFTFSDVTTAISGGAAAAMAWAPTVARAQPGGQWDSVTTPNTVFKMALLFTIRPDPDPQPIALTGTVTAAADAAAAPFDITIGVAGSVDAAAGLRGDYTEVPRVWITGSVDAAASNGGKLSGAPASLPPVADGPAGGWDSYPTPGQPLWQQLDDFTDTEGARSPLEAG